MAGTHALSDVAGGPFVRQEPATCSLLVPPSEAWSLGHSHTRSHLGHTPHKLRESMHPLHARCALPVLDAQSWVG
jgi:hypothetical protein